MPDFNRKDQIKTECFTGRNYRTKQGHAKTAFGFSDMLNYQFLLNERCRKNPKTKRYK